MEMKMKRKRKCKSAARKRKKQQVGLRCQLHQRSLYHGMLFLSGVQ
jgi:hypothetical protein